MPDLSIITINFNNKSGLKQTIESVQAQTNRNFEFIVIDGDSTDGSKEIIDLYTTEIAYSVSEKDKGIYDAQNKGIKNAQGKYLLFLNSGDTFYDNKVLEVFFEFSNKNDYGIIYGNSNLLENTSSTKILTPPATLDTYYFFKHTLNHQACFIQRHLFNEFGRYDTSYKICADFDFFLKVFAKAPATFHYFNQIVCNYDHSGISSAKLNYEQVVKEKNTILKKHLSKEDYKLCFQKAMQEIPIKYRILGRLYRLPLIGKALKKVFQKLM